MKNIIVVATAHKVGSTWVCHLLKEAGVEWISDIPTHLSDGCLLLKEGVEEYFGSFQDGQYLIKSHAYPYKINLPYVKLVTVIRDPRDVVVSAAYYLATLSVEQGGWGPAFAAMPIDGRIKEVIEKGDFLLDRLSAWGTCDYAYCVHYEDLKFNTEAVVSDLFEALGVIPQNTISSVIEQSSFSRLAQKSKQRDSHDAFFRKGITGDWKNYFTDEVNYFFQTVKNGAWAQIMTKLGYDEK